MKIQERILEVMRNVQYIAKDDNVEFGKTKYRALSEEKITSIMRAELIKVGVIVYPIQQRRERVGSITSVDVTYRLQCADDPEDYIDVVSSGDGADTQDKGAGKAMTYAYKYMWLRTFAIPTGEDPDKFSSAELDEKQRKSELAEAVETLKKCVYRWKNKDKDSCVSFMKSIAADLTDVERVAYYTDYVKKQMQLEAQT